MRDLGSNGSTVARPRATSRRAASYGTRTVTSRSCQHTPRTRLFAPHLLNLPRNCFAEALSDLTNLFVWREDCASVWGGGKEAEFLPLQSQSAFQTQPVSASWVEAPKAGGATCNELPLAERQRAVSKHRAAQPLAAQARSGRQEP
jgi:hypothetical protein